MAGDQCMHVNQDTIYIEGNIGSGKLWQMIINLPKCLIRQHSLSYVSSQQLQFKCQFCYRIVNIAISLNLFIRSLLDCLLVTDSPYSTQKVMVMIS